MVDKKISELVLDGVVNLASVLAQARGGQNYGIALSTLETFFRRYDDSAVTPVEPLILPYGDNVQDALDKTKTLFDGVALALQTLYDGFVYVDNRANQTDNNIGHNIMFGANGIPPVTLTWLYPGFVNEPANTDPIGFLFCAHSSETVRTVRRLQVFHNNPSDKDIDYNLYVEGSLTLTATVLAGEASGFVEGFVPISGGDLIHLRAEWTIPGSSPVDVVAQVRVI